MKKYFVILLLLSVLILSGCKKEETPEENEVSLDGAVSTVYEIQYLFNNESIIYTIEVVSIDGELQFIDMDAVANISELSELNIMLDRLAFVMEGVTPDGNEPLCSEIISEGDEITNQEFSCRVTPEEFPRIELEDVDSFEDFMLLAIYQDTETGFDAVYVNISLLSETQFDDYQNK